MRKLLLNIVCLVALFAAGTSLKAQEVTITLSPGWNWISYPNAVAMEVNEALATFTPMEGDMVKGPFSFATYYQGHWTGGLTHFTPGVGYMYCSLRTETTSFVFAQASSISVVTATPTDITTTSATCGGTVTNTGDATVVMRGVCWSTQPNPTIANSHTTNGEGAGNFSSSVSGLTINRVYYLRAYAVTENTVTYGNEVSFTTQLHTVSVSANPPYAGTVSGGSFYQHGQSCTVTATAYEGYSFSNWTRNGTIVSSEANYTFTVSSDFNLVANFAPTGAINGKFSVSGSKQVYFSMGNLQYKASTNTWRFAPYQYSYIGSNNANVSSTYSGWIDLFGWGTSGYDHGAVCYQPWSTSNNGNEYYAYGSANYNLNDQTGHADWGYNAISNGGNTVNQWRTLTESEWNYVLNTRSTTSGKRYAKAIVNGVNGLILLPDDWSTSYYSLNSTNNVNASFSNNVITSSQWSNSLQNHGAVFLPVAGYRNGTEYVEDGWASYWTATHSGNFGACTFDFHNDNLVVRSYGRQAGESVRLVRDVTHSYVDLGLPSGTLWATCNLGAENPKDYGDYFAWGETQPKSNYNWSTYQYCMGSYSTLTKYCNNSNLGYNGFTDNLTTLLPEDDAATANWGAGWRMPTKEEWQELIDNTTITSVTQNGVAGKLFTAPNGNSLFLPAAGYLNESTLNYGSLGFYWSSSLYTDCPYHACRLFFSSDDCCMGNFDRTYGQPVRAVRSGQN